MTPIVTTKECPYLCGECSYQATSLAGQIYHIRNQHSDKWETWEKIPTLDWGTAYDLLKGMIDRDPITLFYKLNLDVLMKKSEIYEGFDPNSYDNEIKKSLEENLIRQKEYLVDYPLAHEVWTHIALTYNALNDFDNSVFHYEKAIDIYRSSSNLFNNIILYNYLITGFRSIKGLSSHHWDLYLSGLIKTKKLTWSPAFNMWRLDKLKFIKIKILMASLFKDNSDD